MSARCGWEVETVQCAACDLSLESEDNYCRRCGAPVRVIEAAPAPSHREVVRIGPSAPAILAGAARPLATGAAAVAAGALVRFAMRRALREIAGSVAEPRTRERPRPLTKAEPRLPVSSNVQVTEVFWYRRITRSERT
jgi:hypothetical protein